MANKFFLMNTHNADTAVSEKTTGSLRAHLFYVLMATFLMVTAFLQLSVTQAKAQAERSEPTPSLAFQRHVALGDVKSGGLLLRTEEDGKFVEAPRLATNVEIDVSGPIVRATVTQRFQNMTDEWVEGIYVFPLPEKAAVDTLRMQIGERLIEGQIKERRLARELYEAARAQGQRASLIEQERANIFTNSVANIGPGETVVIQIRYQETVLQSDGIFSLRFPMVVGPRYNPRPIAHTVGFGGENGWGSVDPVPDRDRITPPVQHPDMGKINPVTLTVNLKPGFQLGDIVSAHHEIDLQRPSDNTATLSLAAGDVPADKDFELTWKATGSAPGAALFRETIDNEDYILLFLTPPSAEQDNDRELLPREVIFVIDNSGSMDGTSIVQAKASLLFALGRLRPVDRFNVIRFDDTMEKVFPGAVSANAANIAFAKGFISQLNADGGTEMLPALKAALVDENQNNTDTLRQIIFLTDGAIGNEDQMFREINRNRGRSRVFTVGIGSAPNSFFMTRAAEIGRGTFTHIGNASQVNERMTALFTKLESPILTDLEVSWSGGIVRDTSPSPLPDLYAGEPIVLTARASDLPDALKITGVLDGNPWTVNVPLARAQGGAGVGKLWARRRIASLEIARQSNRNTESVEKTILAVALEHHIVSRLTSLVAIDVTPARPEDRNVTTTQLPTNLPEGWNFDKVFGENTPAPSRPLHRTRRAQVMPSGPVAMEAASEQESDDMMADQSGPMMFANAKNAPSPAPMAGTPNIVHPGSVLLPQTATPAQRHIMLGIMMFIFAAVCLFTRRLWIGAGHAFNLTGTRRDSANRHIPWQ